MESTGDRDEELQNQLSAAKQELVRVNERLREMGEWSRALLERVSKLEDVLLRDLDKPRRVVIFGSGEGARQALESCGRYEWKPQYIVDNNREKWGKEFLGLPVHDPQSLVRRDFELIIVASQPGRVAISSQLEAMGFNLIADFITLRELEILPAYGQSINEGLSQWLKQRDNAPEVDIAQPFGIKVSDKPLVSVIIPVHNQIEYTYRCLKSIAGNAPSAPFEVIVVDDASTDDTRRILGNVEGARVIVNERNAGFIRSCNAGAKAAKGAYLHFLNNDTEVLPGWLDELVKTFGEHTSVGIAGSMLVYPNGRLQEAGAIIWRDNAAWNYGRGDHPDKPEYNYVREADYISGASIMIPAALFSELGGFDETYLPAYCEDADLALKVRKKGLKTLYQPFSKIIHHEGRSCGVDLSSGVKSYQVRNMQTLFARWGGELAGHRPAGQFPLLEKDRGASKRALVIDSLTPTPDRDSGSMETISFIKILMELGYHVTFYPEKLTHGGDYTAKLQKMGVECLYAPYYNRLGKYAERMGDVFDIVLAQRHSAFQSAYDDLKKWLPSAKIIFNPVDLHFLRERREAQARGDDALMARSNDTLRQEIAMIEKADIVIARSDVERAMIGKEAPSAVIATIPWVYPGKMDIPASPPGYASRKDIAFLGGFLHPPNADAVKHFVKNIFPAIRAALGDVVFRVYGSDAPPDVSALASPSVAVHGYIKDVRECYDSCRVFVAPLRYGAGVKGKIALALLHGAPCVITDIGAEGFGLVDGQSAIIANGDDDFARAVIGLYNDRALWERVSRNGMEHCRELCSFESNVKRFSVIIENLRSAGKTQTRQPQASAVGRWRYIPDSAIVIDEYPVDAKPRFGWGKPPHPELERIIAEGSGRYRDTLTGFLAYAERFAKISVYSDGDSNAKAPHWVNSWFPGLDAISVYGMLARYNPKTYLEVGSGNSTKFARRSIEDNALRTYILSIDPQPRAEINSICDEIARQPLENADLSIFGRLAEGDALFIDNSHRSFQNSDVTVFFTEVLPRVAPGVIIGVHDIFLPYDYPPHWKERYYNEQYLLACYLLGGGGYEILLPNSYISRSQKLLDVLNPVWKDPRLKGIEPFGGAFWFQKQK
jgi:GT2 family glycosyltransferase